MDDIVCPRCKTTKYRCPSLTLMVNVCGHTLCENCVELLFAKGSGACTECGVPLRRCNFRIQLFEDPIVEKEIDIRKRILKDYNKREEDFESVYDYNNYLEEIETIIYNLCNNIDIVNTNKRIEQFKKENKDVIAKNKFRISKDDMELERILETEKHIESIRQKELHELEVVKKRSKNREKEALLDTLVASIEDPSLIVSNFAKISRKIESESKIIPKLKTNQFSSGIKILQSAPSGFLPVPKTTEGPLYIYIPQKLISDGPFEMMNEVEYIKFVRTETHIDRAGGYSSNLPCIRALQEAFSGLYHGFT